MEEKGVMGGFYRVSDWVMRLAYVNLLWIFFTLIGGIIFGVMPATVAVFAVTRKWIMDKDEEVPVFKLFWKSYRSDFLRSNLLGLFLLFGGGILYLYHANLDVLPTQLQGIFKVIFYSVVIIFGMTVTFLFPVFVHFNVNVKQYMKNAFLVGLSFPHYAILMLFITSVSIVVFQYVPVLFIFFGVSVNAILLMKIAYAAFYKIALKQNEKIEEEYNDKSEQISV
ncbi:putative membrane protein YesL [Neobacillus niacini]|uniref:YesL family protein n=1 Tax=Neobacillus niacini TaxID=86668 RepID=UPI00285BEF4B|nr:YesL family protein [Neobacillus niacini]MDR7078470.1 putative membrane protein YesL [Neobacillus niacini]